jgi:hypothetical protein
MIQTTRDNAHVKIRATTDVMVSQTGLCKQNFWTFDIVGFCREER